jgi:hypothetical protein
MGTRRTQIGLGRVFGARCLSVCVWGCDALQGGIQRFDVLNKNEAGWYGPSQKGDEARGFTHSVK